MTPQTCFPEHIPDGKFGFLCQFKRSLGLERRPELLSTGGNRAAMLPQPLLQRVTLNHMNQPENDDD